MRATPASQLHHTQRLTPRPLLAGLSLAALVALAVLSPAGAAAAEQPDPLSRARQLYNEQRYDEAIAAAEKVSRTPALADTARLVIGRSYLEKFRHSANAADLEAGRNALRQVQSATLSASDQVQLLIGLGESLYLDNEFGPAAEIFSTALGSSTPPDLRDTVLDWWASSLDHVALERAPDDREEIYDRIVERMDDELAGYARSMSAAYWLAAAARGAGDLERAWNAAIAGWVRALLSPQHGATLRADLDQLVETAIIPERARDMGPDRERSIAELRKQWEAVKSAWK